MDKDKKQAIVQSAKGMLTKDDLRLAQLAATAKGIGDDDLSYHLGADVVATEIKNLAAEGMRITTQQHIDREQEIEKQRKSEKDEIREAQLIWEDAVRDVGLENFYNPDLQNYPSVQILRDYLPTKLAGKKVPLDYIDVGSKTAVDEEESEPKRILDTKG